MNNADMPAMPVHGGRVWADDSDVTKGSLPAYGLTKREHIAAMALQGLLANPSVAQSDAVIEAIDATDQLLYELERKGGGS